MRRLAAAVGLLLVSAGVFVSVAAALRFTDESYLTPVGVVGTPYRHVFSAPPAGEPGAGCDPPYIFNVDSGGLPPGLSLDSRSGVISGTPTEAGTWSFWASIKDDPTDKPWCNPMSAEREFTITILDKLTIGPESAPPGTVGAAYSLAMTATLSDSKAWSISAGALPPGLALDPVSGVIAGMPTSAGSYPFTVLAVVDPKRSDTKALTIVVRDPLTLTTEGAFAAGRRARTEVGAAFTASFTASGGSGVNTWSISAGSLPPGLALTSSGVVHGRPTAAGAWPFTVAVADDEGRKAAYEAFVSVAGKLAVDTRVLAPATVGRPYRLRLRRTGGVAPVTWRVRSGRLPPGIRLDRARGALSGTPTRSGGWRVVLECRDALQLKAAREFTLVVSS